MIRKLKNIVGRFLKKYKLFFFLILLIPVMGFFWWRWALSAVTVEETASQIFVIKKGESLSSIANRLKAKGLIKSTFAFKLLVLSRNSSSQIQAGDFQLKPSLTAQETAEALTHGTIDVWMTFPEGWRREEVSRRLDTYLGSFDSLEFLDLATNLEGFLFPDTYLMPHEASSAAVLAIFEKNFAQKFSPELERKAKANGLTKNQVLILASIVEREAGTDKDRPLVAGILMKRWRENWPLQADATLQYALANLKCQTANLNCDWWPQITTEAKQIESPFNTYKYKGLPPAPICNPGLASIKAVLEPLESVYWFYLSDSQGETHYAKTVEEHNKNITQYLR